MSLATSVQAPQPNRPRGLRQPARATLVLAWLAFWLNTALFPCCQAFAAIVSDHSVSISEPALHDHVSQDCDDDQPGHNPYSPCGSFVSANPATISQMTLLATDPTSWNPIAPAAIISSFPIALNVANNFTPHEIPPPVRLYLRGPNLRL